MKELVIQADLWNQNEASRRLRKGGAIDTWKEVSRLKASQIAGIEEAVRGARTYDEVEKRLKQFLDDVARARKGKSRLSKETADANGVVKKVGDQLLSELKASAERATAPAAQTEVERRVRNRLEAEELAEVDTQRKLRAGRDYLRQLAKLHRAQRTLGQRIWKGETR